MIISLWTRCILYHKMVVNSPKIKTPQTEKDSIHDAVFFFSSWQVHDPWKC